MTATLNNKKESTPPSPQTCKLTTAQAVIRYLSSQKVELFDGSIVPLFGGIFGIFGHGNVAGIGEALWEYRNKIPYFRGQNEQGMAHTAIAFAKANRARRVMGVTTSIGPGATNMVTAAALAHINRLPVLLLPGDNFASRRPDPVLQQLEDEKFPMASVNDCFAPVSRFFDRILRPEQLLHSLPWAIQTLLHPVRRGPVTLAMPQDTQTEMFDYPESFFEEKIHYIHRPRPDERELQQCANLIRKAKKPLMIIGGGVHYSGAEEALRTFSERHQIPFGETQAGKGCLPWDHPLNLGAIGVTGNSAANAIAKQADLILCVGTRLSDFTTASKGLFHHQEIPFIGLNISPFDAIKGTAHSLIADAKVGLEELSETLSEYSTPQEFRTQINEAQADWEETYQKVIAPPDVDALPTDAQVLATVNHSIDKGDIVVCAAGGLPGELHKHWRTSDPISYHLEYGYSCMGYEIAGGLGAKMAHPDREVYVLVGDGSYLMLHTELLTSLQLGYKINVVLLDNRGFGCINRLQKGCGSPPFGNLFEQGPAVDFVANAKSYGCQAAKVHTLDELRQAIHDNREHAESCVTVIDTDPQYGSPGYAWWDVAVAERSVEKTVQTARREYEAKLSELNWR